MTKPRGLDTEGFGLQRISQKLVVTWSRIGTSKSIFGNSYGLWSEFLEGLIRQNRGVQCCIDRTKIFLLGSTALANLIHRVFFFIRTFFWHYLWCSLPTLAAMYTQCAVSKHSQKLQAMQRSLFDSGEFGGDFTCPQPRFQAVGLAIHKRETWKYACI